MHISRAQQSMLSARRERERAVRLERARVQLVSRQWRLQRWCDAVDATLRGSRRPPLDKEHAADDGGMSDHLLEGMLSSTFAAEPPPPSTCREAWARRLAPLPSRARSCLVGASAWLSVQPAISIEAAFAWLGATLEGCREHQRLSFARAYGALLRRRAALEVSAALGSLRCSHALVETQAALDVVASQLAAALEQLATSVASGCDLYLAHEAARKSQLAEDEAAAATEDAAAGLLKGDGWAIDCH